MAITDDTLHALCEIAAGLAGGRNRSQPRVIDRVLDEAEKQGLVNTYDEPIINEDLRTEDREDIRRSYYVKRALF